MRGGRGAPLTAIVDPLGETQQSWIWIWVSIVVVDDCWVLATHRRLVEWYTTQLPLETSLFKELRASWGSKLVRWEVCVLRFLLLLKGWGREVDSE